MRGRERADQRELARDVLVLLTVAVVLLFLAVLLDGPSPPVRAAAVPMPDRLQDAETPATAGYIYDLEQPWEPMPPEMAAHAGEVWLGCEAGRAGAVAYARPQDVVGASGELGQAQIHPIHFPRMRTMSLDPHSERDRIRYAVWLWQHAGGSWSPWSCGRRLGLE